MSSTVSVSRRSLGFALAFAACTPPSPHPPRGQGDADNADAALHGRARRAPFTCSAGTQAFTPPTTICHNIFFDGPDRRGCQEIEHVVCGRMFGTSAQGKAFACRQPDGSPHGPFEIVEEDGSIVAEGTCRNGGVVGALYRWAHGQLSEALSLQGDGGDGIDGLVLRFDDGHAVESTFENSSALPGCPSDTARFTVPGVACKGKAQVADWPVARACAAREHTVCGMSFGTSEAGEVTACRRTDGTTQGPIVVVDAASGSEAHATCRGGRLSGALIRRQAGRLTEILSMHDGALDGLYLKLADRRFVDEKRFSAGQAEP
jgi:hypothetical protein